MAAGAFHSASAQRTNAICIREDIPVEEAVNDKGYVQMLDSPVTHVTRATHWDVWGENHSDVPVGYSQEMDGSTVLNTHHYTRTFLGSKYDPRGDSGRVWGDGLVQATGTYCDPDIWFSYTQKVYYETTE